MMQIWWWNHEVNVMQRWCSSLLKSLLAWSSHVFIPTLIPIWSSELVSNQVDRKQKSRKACENVFLLAVSILSVDIDEPQRKKSFYSPAGNHTCAEQLYEWCAVGIYTQKVRTTQYKQGGCHQIDWNTGIIKPDALIKKCLPWVTKGWIFFVVGAGAFHM